MDIELRSEVVRSDNTSAATHEMKRSRDLNDNFAALLTTMASAPPASIVARAMKNGVAEHAHYRLKDALDQALILRGSRDFHTTDDYADFVRQMVERRNRLVEGEAGAGDALPTLPTASSGDGIHQLPVQGAQVEHHPGSGT